MADNDWPKIRNIHLLSGVSLYFATPLAFNASDGGVPLGRSP